MSLKQILGRSAPWLGVMVLAFALGVATTWVAMRTVATDIRAEMGSHIANVRNDVIALRTAISALDSDAQKEIAELGRRFAFIERQLGLSPVALPESGAGVDPEHRPPLPPRPPARRSPTDR